MPHNDEPQVTPHPLSLEFPALRSAPGVSPARTLRICAALTATLALLVSPPGTALAQGRPVPDVFTATTTDMTPAGVALKFSVLRWSDDNERSAVVATMSNEADVSKALADLPTVGYVWPGDSPVGYSIKYAHRAQTSDGRERITFVTDKPVGSYDLDPWTAGGASPGKGAGGSRASDDTAGTADDAAGDTLDYSVIVLHPNGEGSGHGTLSLAADVVLDEESNTVSLREGEATATVLTGAAVEPKPYWAQGS